MLLMAATPTDCGLNMQRSAARFRHSAPSARQYRQVSEMESARPATPQQSTAGAAGLPDGISQFITKVLDQLSLSAWLPSALFVAAVFLLLEVHGQKKANLGDAITALTKKPLGALIVVLLLSCWAP
jgi:hypothetical protein